MFTTVCFSSNLKIRLHLWLTSLYTGGQVSQEPNVDWSRIWCCVRVCLCMLTKQLRPTQYASIRLTHTHKGQSVFHPCVGKVNHREGSDIRGCPLNRTYHSKWKLTLGFPATLTRTSKVSLVSLQLKPLNTQQHSHGIRQTNWWLATSQILLAGDTNLATSTCIVSVAGCNFTPRCYLSRQIAYCLC